MKRIRTMRLNPNLLSVPLLLSMGISFLSIHCLHAQSTQKLSTQAGFMPTGRWEQCSPYFEPAVTTDSIAPGQQKIVTGKEGTEVLVRCEDYVHEDGSVVKGAMTFKLTEITTKAGMVLGNMPTVSDGKLLETGGVVRLEAFEDGKPLKLIEGRKVSVQFPGGNAPGMQLFEGLPGASHGMNWKPMNTGIVGGSRRNYSRYDHGFQQARFLAQIKPYMEEGIVHSKKHRFSKSGKSLNQYLVKELASNYPCFGKQNVNIHVSFDRSGVPTSIVTNSGKNECISLAMLEIASRIRWVPKVRLKSASLNVSVYIAAKGRTGVATFVSISDNPAADLDAKSRNALKELHKLRLQEEEKRKIEQFGQYAMQATKLGWINCDRFQSVPKVVSMQVALHNPANANVQSFLVFETLKSVMPGYWFANGQMAFGGIPVGMKAKVVSICYDKTKGAQLGILPVITKEGAAGNMEMAWVTEAELKTKLDAL